MFRYAITGNVGLSDLLSSMDEQIVKAKEQALSRKDILEKLEKWKFASEEEKWLDDYERVKYHHSCYFSVIDTEVRYMLYQKMNSSC